MHALGFIEKVHAGSVLVLKVGGSLMLLLLVWWRMEVFDLVEYMTGIAKFKMKCSGYRIDPEK